MRQKKQINIDIESVLTAEALTSTFEEIAALKMQSMRRSVKQTGAFLEEINGVYRKVKHDYLMSAQYTGKHKKLSPILLKNNRAVYLIITENGGLYGDLPLRIITQFCDSYKELVKRNQADQVDIAVIGSVGAYLLENHLAGVPFTRFEMNDDHPTSEEIDAVVSYVSPYSSIFVVYGYFASLLSIVPKITSISGDIPVVQAKKTDIDTHTVYEPSIEKVAEFFETEILKALFQQKLYEMQLARFATRMVSMDTATQKAQERLVGLKRESTIAQKHLSNKKLQEIFAGASLW